MPKLAPPQTVLIVGGGEFGATTALELARGAYKGQEHLITVLDRSASPPASDAASYDYNKEIVRQEYSDTVYARLAHEAMELWRTPEWKDNYHECGVVVSISPSAAQGGYISQALAVNSLPGMQTPGLEARTLDDRRAVQAVYPADVPLGDFANQDVYINYAGGWANARGATEAVIARCRAAGVTFRQGTAASLIVEGRKVRGVVTAENGDRVTADFTIACMGSWTPTLLPELKDECLPTGQVAATIQLTPEELERYRDVPVTRMIDNGFYIFPPNEEGIVKMAIHQKGYLNPQDGLPSVPRTHLTRGYEYQRVPENARRMLLHGLKRVYPELAAKPWLASRLCWYSDRPSGDWLIDHHPGYEGLFVAAGCAGHAFKFMPILGRLIVQSIEGTLPKELKDIWAYHHQVAGRKDASRDWAVHYRLDSANVSRL